MKTRTVIRWAGLALVTVALAPVVGEWFIQLAAELGLYAKPIDRLAGVWAALQAWATAPAVKAAAWLATGVLVGALGERWLRRATPAPPPATADALTISTVSVEDGALTTDRTLRISLLVFNGNPEPVTVADVSGRLSVCAFPAPPDGEPDLLPSPSEVNRGATLAAYGDGFVQFTQRVPGTTADAMVAWLGAGGLQLNFGQLSVELAPAGHRGRRLSLRLWSAVRVWRSGERTSATRHHVLRAESVVTGTATLRG